MRSLCPVAVLALVAASTDAAELKRVANPIPGRYIVVLKPTIQAAGLSSQSVSDRHVAQFRVQRSHVYRAALQGYAAALSDTQVQQLLLDPEVDYVEPDQRVWASATQTGATWGLDRIDQRDRPLSGTYTYNFDGTGVHAYIVDTGIRASHVEFTGRMGNGFTSINDGNGTNDCAGHGTHVAGTVGGTTYGVAKRVTLHAVRVLDCGGSGTNAGVIAGVDWVRLNHVKPAVANMSLGGGASSALDSAVANAVSAGVTFAVAAGNENADACTRSPARTASAITVGSTTNVDARSSFSNWGTCVDIFGPGSGITSAWITSNTATNTISGTSMATPHVAGVVALYLHQHGHTAPSAVVAALNGAASLNKLTGIGTGSPNRLLYSLFGTVPPTATPTPNPTATPTPTPTPRPTIGPTPIAFEIPASATASTHDGNVPANALDGNLSTRWSANGDGQWLRLDFVNRQLVTFVTIGVYNGNGRRNQFDLQASDNGVDWTSLVTGAQTSGTTTAEERFDVPPVITRYLRYLGHGNSVNTWNSVTEISAFTPSDVPPTPTPTPTPTHTPMPTPTATATPTGPPPPLHDVTPPASSVTASTSDDNVPGNTVDNNLATRWSGNGDGAWIQFDIGQTHALKNVTISVYNGSTRSNRFDLQVATTEGAWSNVLTGAVTSGETTPFELPAAVPARWVRYVGHGNTDPMKGSWNSLTEVRLWAAD